MSEVIPYQSNEDIDLRMLSNRYFGLIVRFRPSQSPYPSRRR